MMPILKKNFKTNILENKEFNQQITAFKLQKYDEICSKTNKQQKSITGKKNIKINKNRLPLDWFPQIQNFNKGRNNFFNLYKNSDNKDSVSTKCDKLNLQEKSKGPAQQLNQQQIRTSSFELHQKVNQTNQLKSKKFGTNQHIPLQIQNLTEFQKKDQNQNRQKQNFHLRINRKNNLEVTFADKQLFGKSLSCRNIKKQLQTQLLNQQKYNILPKLKKPLTNNSNQLDKVFNLINLSSNYSNSKNYDSHQANKENIIHTNKLQALKQKQSNFPPLPKLQNNKISLYKNI